MEFNIKEGTIGKEEMQVQNEHTASRYGSGLIEVFATPAMVGFMESTAQKSIQHQLPEGFITLGIEINVKHKKATPVGIKVTCESKLVKVDGKKLYFEIKAFDEEAEIGEATHKRYIVEGESFIKNLIK